LYASTLKAIENTFERKVSSKVQEAREGRAFKKLT